MWQCQKSHTYFQKQQSIFLYAMGPYKMEEKPNKQMGSALGIAHGML